MIDVHERRCRGCHAALRSVLNLGVLAISGFPEKPGSSASAPLDLCRCVSCGLVQLRHTVDPDLLFRQYWYRSGVNETMCAELSDVVANGIEYVGGLVDGDTVMDIGANDGTLLAEYARYGTSIKRIAYEPAKNFNLWSQCDVCVRDYFPSRLSSQLRFGRMRIITSIACFYAVDAPGQFVQAIADSLMPSGVWIVQFQDLHQMLQATAFDDICHEHVFYPSLVAMERLIAPYGLVVLDAQHRRINGGSLRLIIGFPGRPISPRVAALRAHEEGCESWDTLSAFASRVESVRMNVRAIVDRARQRGRVVDLYGASTKGNTLLQVCGLGPDVIRQVWERSAEKWGHCTITGIPIVSEQDGRDDPPDVLLVAIWQFREAILAREAAYLERGGELVFPLPHVKVVRLSEETTMSAPVPPKPTPSGPTSNPTPPPKPPPPPPSPPVPSR